MLLSLMQSKTPIMPLQLIISIFLLIFLLPPAFSTSIVAEPGCRDRCGNVSIPYPFGVGSNCFFNPSYDIACNTTTEPPKAYLSLINAEVIEIKKTYIRVKYLDLVSACYDLSVGPGTNVTTAASYKHSQSANLSGTPYTMSDENMVIAIGCDDMLLVKKADGGAVSGGCSVFCAKINDRGSVGYCPNNATSLGNGCCQAHIYGGVLEEAQLIDMSQNFQRRKLFPCSYAFLQEEDTLNEMAFSYPLFYLENSTTLLNDIWAPVVQMYWMIGAENCSQAKLNSSYACRDEKSVCVDNADNDYYGTGYQCRCVQGYEGNPYLPGGCKPISFTSSIAKAGCKDQCGKLSIPFPFGIGRDCYREPSFEITCNTSINPPKAYLSILNAEVIQLNSSLVLVNYQTAALGFTCYNLSKYKTEEHSLIIDLYGTQYTLSNENWITAIGCDDMVVGNIRQGNRSFIGSGCSTVCKDAQLNSSFSSGYCPIEFSDSNGYLPGDGCCRTPIPKGTTYLEVNLSDFSGQWRRKKFFSCSYALVSFKSREILSYRLEYLNNSTAMEADELPDRSWRRPTMALDWKIGAVNCKEAKLDAVNFACKANSDCIDFDTTVGGYLCNCSIGYEGNPYLDAGCQDINECVDHTINPCGSNSICINTAGSFHCSCQKGYLKDARKDGTGCIKGRRFPVITIGVLSGLGPLLFLFMCFWLYKALQKRKEQMLKEKFFKRNGGLLLRQQTNKDILVNTKLFLSKELEIATDYFNKSRILGSGGQGTVFKGMLSDGKIVAIKKSRLIEEDHLEQFINEVVILSQINHRNVVKLLGYCLETEVPLLVYEFMPNGTLFGLIHDSNKEFPFSWNMRLKMAADVAGALAYLHSATSVPIYHRDIKSSNILLDEKYVVKVSDFGTSRSVTVDQTHLTTMVKGTFGYLDPEYFQSSQFTEKSDVYSFGVVLVELLTGQRPISLDKTNELRGLATRFLTSMEENNLDTILDCQVLDQGTKEEVILVARLAQRCLNLKGKMRPTMKKVATELESFRISQKSIGVKDEFEEVGGFKDVPTMISDIEYTWTSSYEGATASSSDTLPLKFATN